jgi:hypothetical protein
MRNQRPPVELGIAGLKTLSGPVSTICCRFFEHIDIEKISPLTLRFRRDRRQVSVFSAAAGQTNKRTAGQIMIETDERRTSNIERPTLNNEFCRLNKE